MLILFGVQVRDHPGIAGILYHISEEFQIPECFSANSVAQMFSRLGRVSREPQVGGEPCCVHLLILYFKFQFAK